MTDSLYQTEQNLNAKAAMTEPKRRHNADRLCCVPKRLEGTLKPALTIRRSMENAQYRD